MASTASRGNVVVHVSRPMRWLDGHEGRTLCSVARSIARLKNFNYAGRHDGACFHPGSLFFVPDETLLQDEAQALGIQSAKDFFGGIVPYSFVRTKAITHPLVTAAAERPLGWSSAFAERIKPVVLPGYSVFARDDARRAACQMLEYGAVRTKRPLAAGGRGQRTLSSRRDTEALLAGLDELGQHGLVLEAQLDDVTTLSIGTATLDDLTIAYYGRQRETRDNEGR